VAYPAILFVLGFLHEEERSGLADLLRPSAIAARAKGLRAASAEGEGGEALGPGPEVYEEATRDEDRPGV
jgi:hypothetical protein